jgi:hypothetical protein
MEQTRIELHGWKALIVLVAILGMTSYRFYSRFQPVDDGGRGALQDWLMKDYEGQGPRSLALRAANYRAGIPSAPTPVTPVGRIEFSSLSAHGLRGIMVVRAEVTVDGGPPPDGRRVRYLDLTTKVGGGWMVMADTSSLQYYLALVR